MKKFIVLIIIFMINSGGFAAEIGLQGVEKDKIKMTPKVNRDEKNLLMDKDKAMKDLIAQQQKKDLEDIENLWKSTIENNNIIKFAMRKLSAPPEQQRFHSSLMAKSVSALISGASFVPSLFGSNYMVQSASYATGRLANSYLTNKNNPKEPPMTDTELIELAGMIESLQDTIINSYYNYKAVLVQIKETRQQLVLYNKNYSEALKTNDEIEIVVSSSMYDDLLYEEYRLMQQAKKISNGFAKTCGQKNG